MAIKVGINGFGRIGRNVLRASVDDPGIEFVAVNDLTDAKTLAHLLKYDSILGVFDAKVEALDSTLVINEQKIKVFSEPDIAKLDWGSVGAQIVIESTGRYVDRDKCALHLRDS